MMIGIFLISIIIILILIVLMDSFKYNKDKVDGMSLKQRILTVAIAILLVLFIGFGINTFYEPPQYDEYCRQQYGPYYPEKIGGPNCTDQAVQTQKLIDNCTTQKGYLNPVFDDRGCVASYTCETCQNEFQEANEGYNNIVFIAALLLGIICMIIAVILKNDTVSPGILGGGFLTILYGTIRDWTNLNDYFRLALLGIALAILIWIGYKKIAIPDEDRPRRKKRR